MLTFLFWIVAIPVLMIVVGVVWLRLLSFVFSTLLHQ